MDDGRVYRVEEPGAPYGADSSLLRDLAQYGREVHQKTRDYEAWADAMRKEFGERVEPHLRQAWDEMRRPAPAATPPVNDPEKPAGGSASGTADRVRPHSEPTVKAVQIYASKRRLLASLVVLIVAMGLTAIIAFAWLVWPTPWRYHTTQQQRLMREHRWSGRLEVLYSDGWRCRVECE